MVPALRAALSAASSSLLISIRDVVCAVPALQTLAVRIDQLLDDEVCSGKAAFIAVTQQVFAIRTGVDGFLDVGACGGVVSTPAFDALHGAQLARRTARRPRPFKSTAPSCQPPRG